MNREDLNRHIVEIVRRVLGPENKALSSAQDFRWGNGGSLSVNPETGDWYDHENNIGGGPLEFLELKAGMVNGAAVEWLKSDLGFDLDFTPNGRKKSKVVASYNYYDKDGNLEARKLRWEPKFFSWQRYENGNWIGGRGALRDAGIKPSLYCSRELRTLIPGSVVDIVEGEKDVHTAALKLGLFATCNPDGGSKVKDGARKPGKWRPEFNELIRDHYIRIIPDNDEVGIAHANAIAESVVSVAREGKAKIVKLPAGKDLTDWVTNHGGTREALEQLTADTPFFVPPPDTVAPAQPTKNSEKKDDRRLQIGSDLEIAQRVACDLKQQFNDVLFDGAAFYRYGGQCWEEIDEDTLRQGVYIYDGAIFETAEGKLSSVKLSKSRINSVLFELRTVLAQRSFFDQAAFGINCKSGFITFDQHGNPMLLPHDPGHRCRHVLPGSWQPGAVFDRPPENSLLARMLNGCFRDDPDETGKRKLVAEIAGAAATGYGAKLLQPKAVILKGPEADNGKSQFLDMLRGLLPASAISSVTASKMGDERHIIGLQGKLLNASDELSSAAIASNAFKAAVTGEPIAGRDVFKSRIEFRSIALNVFAVNILPSFSGGMDRGVQRRLLVLEFNRVIPQSEMVQHIGNRVAREEPDLLLAMAVSGASRLIQQRSFSVPASSKDALDTWIYESDPVPAWVEARVEKADPPLPGQKIVGIKSSFAYSLFRDWARSEGFREATIPEITGFVQRLKANKTVTGITGKHTKSGNWLLGLKILATDRDPNRDGIREAPRWIDLNTAGHG